MIKTQNGKSIISANFVPGVKAGFIALLFGLIYYPIFVWMWQRWFSVDSYFSHGPIIPVISGILIWLKRYELAEKRQETTRLGLWILLAGLFIHIIGAYIRVYFISAYSSIIVITGLTLYFFGKKVASIIIFPLLFMLFMVPIPLALIAAITLKMKLLTAHISVLAIQLFGIQAIREGSMVYMSNTNIMVGDPCSGLKNLISLLALTALYLYIVKASYLRKLIIFLASIPIAIIANIFRTSATLLMANEYGNDIVNNALLHKGFGIAVFIIAIAGLFLIGRLLGCQVQQKDI